MLLDLTYRAPVSVWSLLPTRRGRKAIVDIEDYVAFVSEPYVPARKLAAASGVQTTAVHNDDGRASLCLALTRLNSDHSEPDVLTLLLTATDSMVSCFSSRGTT